MSTLSLLQDAEEVTVSPSWETARRSLDIFMLFDCSGSMMGQKIAVANQAMRESISELKQVMGNKPEIEHRIRCISFASDAHWHVGPKPVNLEDAYWEDLTTGGATATGEAIQMLAEAVQVDSMPRNGVPPLMVLVSDGGNTDGRAFDIAIDALNNEPWGSKAVRLSIGIGEHYDHEQLSKFTNHAEIGVLEAKNAIELANQIRYATVTTVGSIGASSITSGRMSSNMALLPPPSSDGSDVNLEVF